MRDKKQIIENIKRKIANVNPYMKRDLARVTSYIFDCFKTFKEEALTDMEYYDIVGAIFKFNPKFYMDSIYPKMKSLELTRYIIENYCLYEGEKIIYEFPGKIKQSTSAPLNPVVTTVKGGNIFVTNLRIIAHGKLVVGGGDKISHSAISQMVTAQMAKKARERAKKRFLNESLSQDLPCYGYQFRIKNQFGLKKKSSFVNYQVSDERFTEDTLKTKTYYEIRQAIKDIKIKLPKIQVTELYEILSKDVDPSFEIR